MFRSLLAAFLLVASTAFAQVSLGQLVCVVDAGAPALLRAEGVAEKVNDIVITCTGGIQGASGLSDLTVALNNAYVTSRVVAPVSSASEAILIVDDLASPPVVGTNLIQGTSTGNQVTFRNVPIVAPGGSGQRTFRIINLRVNVHDTLPDNTLINASLTFSSGLQLSNPVPTLGITAAGVFFSIQTDAGAPVQNFSVQSGGGGALTHRLRFTEGFAQSFRKRNTATSVATPNALSDQSIPGTDYHTESMFYDTALPSTNALNVAGLATQGSRLVARFSNMPAGAVLYVTTAALPNTGAVSAALTSADASGAGAYAAAAQIGTVTVDGAPVGIAPVTLTNGAGTATWELLDADPAALESYTFGVVVVSAQSGVATVVGGLGPISASSVADATSPVPRFGDTSAQQAACAASPCLTAAPGAILVSYQTGTAAPAPITIQVGSSASPLAFTAAAIAAPEGWLSVTPSSGVTPASLQVTINPVNLTPNTYQANIVITSGAQTFSIPVIVTVTIGPSGFVPLGCVVNVANPTQLRGEATSELLSDIVVHCTGGTPTPSGVAVPTFDVKVTLNTPITSRTYANGWSEALLIMDEAGALNFSAITPNSPAATQAVLARSPEPATLRARTTARLAVRTYSRERSRVTS